MSGKQSLLEWLRWMALMGVDNEVVMLQGGALERCAEAAVEIERLRAAGDVLCRYVIESGPGLHDDESVVAYWLEARRE
jgi:hypothetical protein